MSEDPLFDKLAELQWKKTANGTVVMSVTDFGQVTEEADRLEAIKKGYIKERLATSDSFPGENLVRATGPLALHLNANVFKEKQITQG